MSQFSRLIKDHLPWLQDDLVKFAIIVIDLQRPGRVNILLDVQDGRYHMGPEMIKMTEQERSSGVLPDSIH